MFYGSSSRCCFRDAEQYGDFTGNQCGGSRGSPVLGPPQSCAPNSRPFCPKSGGANLNSFASEGLCALSHLVEGTKSSLSKPHSSRTFRSQLGSSFRFQKSDTHSEKCRFENEMSLSQENFPIIPQLLVLPFY